jgi:hypothetical protein
MSGNSVVSMCLVTGAGPEDNPSREKGMSPGCPHVSAGKYIIEITSLDVIIVSKIRCQSRHTPLAFHRLLHRRLQFEKEQSATHHRGRNDHEVDYRDRCRGEISQSEAH